MSQTPLPPLSRQERGDPVTPQEELDVLPVRSFNV